MQWIAPSEKDTATNTLEKRLWEAADQLRANSGLTAAQYSSPVLGLIFLRFAEARFAKRRHELEKAGSTGRRGSSRIDEPGAYHAEGVVYLTPNARYERLLNLPEGENIGKEVNEAALTRKQWRSSKSLHRGDTELASSSSPTFGATADSGHPISLRRSDRKQPAAHQDFGRDGPLTLPRVVRQLPLPRTQKSPARRFPAREDSEGVGSEEDG